MSKKILHGRDRAWAISSSATDVRQRRALRLPCAPIGAERQGLQPSPLVAGAEGALPPALGPLPVVHRRLLLTQRLQKKSSHDPACLAAAKKTPAQPLAGGRGGKNPAQSLAGAARGPAAMT